MFISVFACVVGGNKWQALHQMEYLPLKIKDDFSMQPAEFHFLVPTADLNAARRSNLLL